MSHADYPYEHSRRALQALVESIGGFRHGAARRTKTSPERMFNAVGTRAEVAIVLLVAVGPHLVSRAPMRIVWPPAASPYAALDSALQFIFAREQFLTQSLQIHIGIPCLSEHPARLLLF